MQFNLTDWLVLIFTLLLIICYGVYKSRISRSLEGYYLSNREMPWWLIMLSVMGTQASAITFLTAPGQAFTDGMRFVQYYFGLPLAMIVLCISFVPIFHRLKVFTAYEYLENRFDLKTRSLTSFLFLLSRGTSTGISIYAPSLVLHSMLGWDIYITNMIMGGMVIVYTISGGARAVAYTQTLQFVIIYLAMFLSAWYALKLLPEGIGITEALHIGGKSGKLNVITSGMEEGSFNWKDRYNIWSGIIGGFFLALSYFGTDQSQVGRYLTAKSEGQSKIGLLMNGMFKVPLQFFILLIGIFVFVFYQFNQSPAYFNMANEKKVLESVHSEEYINASRLYSEHMEKSRAASLDMSEAIKANDENRVEDLRTIMLQHEQQRMIQRDSIRRIVGKALPDTDVNDTNFIFLRFVGDNLPHGLIGLIIAIIFLASWGSVAAALNSLSGATMIDFHKKFSKKDIGPAEAYRWSKFYTFLWGIFCIIVAQFASNFGNSLIEAVNILGSWFYGTILGIFLVAFFIKYIKGWAVFLAAIAAEIIVISVYRMEIISFLWLNLIGAAAVVIFGYFFQFGINMRKKKI